MSHVGRSVRRNEDGRLLRGAGRFVDDVDRAREEPRVLDTPDRAADVGHADAAAFTASRID